MLHYYRFHNDIPHPVAAHPSDGTPGPGEGWPQHCPPVRAANAFGWDVINPFTMTFIRDGNGRWDIEEEVEVHSDVDLDDGHSPGPQLNAWFWEQGQMRPHPISDNVYAEIQHQCKVSTFLYLETEPGWMLWLGGVPNRPRPWSVIEAVIETDWYKPAHPWHGVIELPRIDVSPIDRITIEQGQALFRLTPIQRCDYAAQEMSGPVFARYFEQGQQWLAAHGRDFDPEVGDVDITGRYAKQQDSASFAVKREARD